VAFCALLLRIGIEKLISINIAQNESSASLTLKLISTALENFARDKNGAYPEKLSLLTNTKPPYLDKSYISDFPVKGYYLNCSRLEPSGYNCSAVPVKCRLTGNAIYTISTGGALESEDCIKKE